MVGVSKLEMTKRAQKDYIITHPHLTQEEIAEKLGTTQQTVSNRKKDLAKNVDYMIAKKAADGFVEDYETAIEAFKLQISRLEELGNSLMTDIEQGTKTIMTTEGDTTRPLKVKLDTMEKVAIKRELARLESQKSQIWVKIITLARQSQAIDIMKLISGRQIELPDPPPPTKPTEQAPAISEKSTETIQKEYTT